MAMRSLIQIALIVLAVAIVSVSALMAPLDGDEEEFFAVEGIFYAPTHDDQVMVVGFDRILEVLDIPAKVVYNDVIYTVTVIDGYGLVSANLSGIYIPESVESIEGPKLLRDLRWIEVSPLNLVYASSNGILFTKDMTTLLCYPKSLAYTSYSFPDTVTTIGESSFAGNPYLEEITMGQKIRLIESGAFQGCTSLKWINHTAFGNILPDELLIIESYAFQDCESLDDIVLPESLLMVENEAFSGCGISSILINDGVTWIGDGVFTKCRNLVTISTNNSKYEAEGGVLFEIDPDNNLKTLKTYPCAREDPIYEIPYGVTDIAQLAFDGARYLEELVFPMSMTTVPSFSIQDAISLKSVVLSNTILSLETNCFYGCVNLTEIEWGGNVTVLQVYSLANTGFADMVVPNSVLYIQDEAFAENRNLQTVYLPASVQYMGGRVFADDLNLDHIEFAGSAPTMAKDSLVVNIRDTDEFVVHLWVQKGFELPEGVSNEYNIIDIEVLGERPYPQENLIAAVLCIILLLAVVRAVKDV